MFFYRTFIITGTCLIFIALLSVPVAAQNILDQYDLTEGDVISSFAHDSDPDIYIPNAHGFKRIFVSPQIFNVYDHLRFDAVTPVSPETRDIFATSAIFRNCQSNNEEVYALEVRDEDTGVLHHIQITGEQAVAEDSNFFKQVFCINDAEQALYLIGEPYTSLSQIPSYHRTNPVESPDPVPDTRIHYELSDQKVSNLDAGIASKPALADIDNDGDLDLFVSNSNGTISFLRGRGSDNSSFILEQSTYEDIDVGMNASIHFVDIDNDGDFDLLSGRSTGTISFYLNDRDKTRANFKHITHAFNAIDVGTNSTVVLGDLDADGDHDLLVGNSDGVIYHYSNQGNLVFVLESSSLANIDVGENSSSALTDIDADNDLDLIVGNAAGAVMYYENTGSASSPAFSSNGTQVIQSIGTRATPFFIDSNGDGIDELYVGRNDGAVDLYSGE